MELHQLRYFVAVAKAGSFVKAAEAEDVSQPTVSAQIQKLEGELGVPLFDRLGRSVKLTRFGQTLLPQALETISRLAEAEKRISEMKNPNQGHLAVGVIPTILPYFLAPALPEFRVRHPGIELALEEHPTAVLLERLRNGELDVVILALPITQPDTVCSELFRDPLVAIAPPGHPLIAGGAADLRVLQQERLLLLREGHCLRDNVLTACRRAHAQFEKVFESDYLGSIFALVAAGLGLSIVPEMAIAQHPGCVTVPLRQPAYRRIGYAQSKQHYSAKVQRVFTGWLREVAQRRRPQPSL